MKISEFKKYLLAVIGVCVSFSALIVLAITFFNATLTGGRTLVTINNYGEQKIETIVIILGLILGLYSLIYLIRMAKVIK
jgi:uncharacterized membrane protein